MFTSENFGKCIIFSAPSGAGKTTIVHQLLKRIPSLSFSVSACSRAVRGEEKDQKDYFFLSLADFKQKIENGEFVEWQEVYTDNFYGTLKTELDRIWSMGKVVIFDVDVIGGLNLKRIFGKQALAIFVQPPSFEVLEHRLRGRSTETNEKIIMRLSKAKAELSQASEFDSIIINDNLEEACDEAQRDVEHFLNQA